MRWVEPDGLVVSTSSAAAPSPIEVFKEVRDGM